MKNGVSVCPAHHFYIVSYGARLEIELFNISNFLFKGYLL